MVSGWLHNQPRFQPAYNYQQYSKGLVINYGEGGLQNWKIMGPNFFVPSLKTAKTFCAPLLRLDYGGFGFIC